MPGNPRAIIAEAEQRFPVRIVIRVPEGGIGSRYMPMTDWLGENCGIRGCSITPAGTRGVRNDAAGKLWESKKHQQPCPNGFLKNEHVPPEIDPFTRFRVSHGDFTTLFGPPSN